MNKLFFYFKNGILLFMPAVVILSCQNPNFKEPSPSLESYEVTEGFELSILASEPLLEAPIAMDFDNIGRMWVVEMRGYMTNLEGLNEDEPNGRITILEDLDHDGVADHGKVFLENLVLPRAIAHVYGGLLYAEPPNLWFVEIDNDQPGKRTLVDSIFADAGNVEHQPNGLLMNVDNWIYNGNSNFRYQLKDGKWLKEPTSYRGQWGISKDNFGRLYHNNNTTLLRGDLVLPNTATANKYFSPRGLVNSGVIRNQRVYPLHATAVNRGYQPGVLDSMEKLINVTSSCGPLIFSGSLLSEEYSNNAFVCAPEANLVKRLIMDFDSIETTAKQAWEDKEFIASTDEGFRPVNLYEGPDGGVYIVDMHRGIIQHKAFISKYLTKKLKDRDLDTILGMGRILKVKNASIALDEIPNFETLSSKGLVALLKTNNTWIRDRSQQLLVDKKDKSIVNELIEIVQSTNAPQAQISALYILKSYDELTYDILQKVSLNKESNFKTVSHALILLKDFADISNVKSMASLISNLMFRNEEQIDLYLALGLNPWLALAPEFINQAEELSKRHEDSRNIQLALVVALEGMESVFLENHTAGDLLKDKLNTSISNRRDSILNPIFVNVGVREDNRTNGLKLYRSICAACHGPAGNGIENIAPPLRKSEYVSGSIEKLALIILHGMSGPVHVNKKLYELSNVMPGMSNNPDISDRDIVDIIHFLQNAFVEDEKRISTDKVGELRLLKSEGEGLYTEEQLRNLNL